MLMSLKVFCRLKSPCLTLRVESFGTYSKVNKINSEMRVLNVAEKNDAAKNIAYFLSGGRVNKRDGVSRFNKIYEFECEVQNKTCKMIMTSVSGHLLSYDFVGTHRSWKLSKPISLFSAPIKKICPPGNESVKKNLEKEISYCNVLIVWTDCDREGENIGFEIIDVCKEVKSDIKIYRAKFSEITKASVMRAIKNLEEPNKHLNNAVNVRMELDLRIGAAFTRFQCLHLQRAFPGALKDSLVSYGSCQFPTLGFVVERFKAITDFVPEPFWKIRVSHTINTLTVRYDWSRVRLFNKLACEVIYDKVKECGTAKVEKVVSKPKTKWRPKPLDTVELEKLASKKLKINAKETLKIAEKLYTQGLISYPRTETNIFPADLNLVSLVDAQKHDPSWGEFAERVLRDGPNPFQGNKSDQAHPPIHPIKYSNTLTGNDKKVYEFIVRHFLACLSKHAEGLETLVHISIEEEEFLARGLMIVSRNYLDVYPYENWSENEIHIYREGDTFTPEILMAEEETNPPELLTEADLISLMEKHGIGTDATHAEHIETIKARLYVGLQNNKYFVPRTLGMGLVEGYNKMGYEMSKPNLRADLEADLKRICSNQISPEVVLSKYTQSYKDVFVGVQTQINCLSETIQNYLQIEAVPVETEITTDFNEEVLKCSMCSSQMFLKAKKDGLKFIGCSNYPHCRNALWFPSMVKKVQVLNDTCSFCGPSTHLLKFELERGSCYLAPEHVGCVGGCDENLLEVLSINSGSRINRSALNNSNNLANKRSSVCQSGVSNTLPASTDNDSGFISITEKILRNFDSKEESTPNCFCKVPSIRLTVKKSGPNSGRVFYKCKMLSNSAKCNFFKWEDEGVGLNNIGNSRPRIEMLNKINNVTDENNEENEYRCYCAIPCRRLIVNKEGNNKGRAFLACGRSQNDANKCNFFKWVIDK